MTDYRVECDTMDEVGVQAGARCGQAQPAVETSRFPGPAVPGPAITTHQLADELSSNLSTNQTVIFRRT